MKTIIKLIIVLAISIAINGCGEDGVSSKAVNKVYKSNPNFVNKYNNEDEYKFDRDEMLVLINEARINGIKCGDEFMPSTHELTYDTKLDKSSMDKSTDLSVSGIFGHGSSMEDSARFLEGKNDNFVALIKYYGTEARTKGENIAMGFNTVEEVFEAWMESPGHCKNIMSNEYYKIGISAYNENKYAIYWTQHFASR